MCHATEHVFWYLNANLKAPTIVAPPVLFVKTEEGVLLDVGGVVLQVKFTSFVQFEFHPVLPVFFLYLVVHCRSGNYFPCSIKVTSDVESGVR